MPAKRVTSVLVLFASAALGGCGLLHKPPAAAQTQAAEPAQCEDLGVSRALSLDWPGDARSNLEARAKSGVVAIEYTGCRVRILTQCEVPGSSYQYRGVTPGVRKLALRDSDDLRAELPLGAAGLEADLRRAGQLTVQMSVVGYFAADRGHVRRDELKGDCDAATHIVHGFSVGAFEFFAGADTHAAGGAEVLGVLEASGRTTSHREMITMDGVPNTCWMATPGAPPATCAAPIRVEVVPVGAPKEFQPVCKPGTTWNGENCERELVLTTTKCLPGSELVGDQCVAKRCPAGATWDGTECVARVPKVECPDGSTVSSGHQCASRQKASTRCVSERDCREECKQGHGASCTRAGELESSGNRAIATSLFAFGCSLDDASGCRSAAIQYDGGIGVPRDPSIAARFLAAACNLGDGDACYIVGARYASGSGVAVSRDLALANYKRACDLGTGVACSYLGQLHIDGHVKAPVGQRGTALRYFDRACSLGSADACQRARALRANSTASTRDWGKVDEVAQIQ